MKSVAVFCGSNFGNNSTYGKTAQQLARVLTELNIKLIYGGASIGLMGVMADAVLSSGGEVIGVIPQSLVDFEVAHSKLTHLHIVETMHARKKLIFDLADAFIMLPGGIGSLDEFFEIFTWYQLGLHKKPLGIINANDYFNHLIKFLDHSVVEGFLKNVHRDLVLIEQSPTLLIEKLSKLKVPATINKWR